MKDLYRRIGIPSQTNDLYRIEQAIRHANRAVSKEDVEAVKLILLNPGRKKAYDRNRKEMVRIGQLRVNMGLSSAPNWRRSGDCSDFDTPFKHPVTSVDLSGENDGGCGSIIIAVVILLIVSYAANNFFNTKETGLPPLVTHSENDRSAQSETDRKNLQIAREKREKKDKEKRDLDRRENLKKLVLSRYRRVDITPSGDQLEADIQKLLTRMPDPMPKTGVLSRQDNWIEGMMTSRRNTGYAPLEIKTDRGSSYFIKVVHWGSKDEVLTAFIRGGDTFETLVPLGSYEIKYASGRDWYGPILDFGQGASYSRCDDRFDFKETLNGYSGFTVELIKQINGNLETDPIAADDF